MSEFNKPVEVQTDIAAMLAKAIEAWLAGDQAFFKVLEENAEIAATRRQLFAVVK